MKKIIASLLLYAGISLAQEPKINSLDSLNAPYPLSREDSMNIERIIGDHWPGIKDTLLHSTKYVDSLDATTKARLFVSEKQKKSKPCSLGFHIFWEEWARTKWIELVNNYSNGLSTIDYIIVGSDTSAVDTIKNNDIIKDTLNYKKYKLFFQQVYNTTVALVNSYNSNLPLDAKRKLVRQYWTELKQKIIGFKIVEKKNKAR